MTDTGAPAGGEQRQVMAGVYLTRRVRAGGVVRCLTSNVGHTPNRNRISLEELFTPSEVPGLDTEAPYFETGVNFELLPNTELGAPPGGTRALVRFSQFRSRRLNAPNLKRLEAFAERMQMLLNQQRAIVFSARTILSVPENGERIPFYLQPQLGGPWDLRGLLAGALTTTI